MATTSNDKANRRIITETPVQVLPVIPNSSAWGFKASITNWMWASISTPSNSTLLRIMSRSTLAANALSFSFFFYALGLQGGDALGPHQAARDNEPRQFIAGQQCLVHRGLRRQIPRRLMEGNGVGDLLFALLPQPIHNPFRMLLGPLVVIGVVEQARDAPNFGIAAEFGCRRPHHDFDGASVGEQRWIRCPGLKLLNGLVTGEGHGGSSRWPSKTVIIMEVSRLYPEQEAWEISPIKATCSSSRPPI